MQKNNMQSEKIGMGQRTKIITEYRQTAGDADGDNIVGMGRGWQ